MHTPVPFGQYVPIDSPVHSLESRAKMALLDRNVGGGPTQYPCLAACWAEQPQEHLGRGRLAGAVRTQEGKDFTREHLQIEVNDGLHTPPAPAGEKRLSKAFGSYSMLVIGHD